MEYNSRAREYYIHQISDLFLQSVSSSDLIEQLVTSLKPMGLRVSHTLTNAMKTYKVVIVFAKYKNLVPDHDSRIGLFPCLHMPTCVYTC